MPRRSKVSATPLVQVRRHFGLDQATLAAYLGVGAGMIGHLEAGRKPTSLTATQRLLPLLQAALAPTEASNNPAAHLAPPDPALLQVRLDYCQHHARKLQRELAALTQKLEIARRWQAALPGLLAGAADERARAWLLRRQEQAAADLDGETSARYHLLQLRVEALETEIQALHTLLETNEKIG